MNTPTLTPVTTCPAWCGSDHRDPIIDSIHFADAIHIDTTGHPEVTTQNIAVDVAQAPGGDSLVEMVAGYGAVVAITPAHALALSEALARAAHAADRNEPLGSTQ